MKVMIAVAVIVLALVGSIVGAWALALNSINTSQRNWCATLTLLSAHPVPKPSNPAKNPSRVNAYVFYTDIVKLRDQFGCG